MSRAAAPWRDEQQLLAAPRVVAVVTVVVAVVTAGVFAVVAERGMLVRIQRVDDAWLLWGGSALVTLAYIGGLAAAVQAFGGGAGFAAIGAVYLAAAAIAAVSPTPGGLGAIEAALVAGLTGVGLSPGAASAVLTYRLATYWLPVAPGWISLRVLQRQGYL